MDTDFLIQTTNNLYRLTLFFPEKEPLRYKMREKASNILANGNNGNKYGMLNLLLEDLETLNLFLEVAKEQDWVNVSDVLVVQTGYFRLKKELKEWKELNGVRSEWGQTPLNAGSDPTKPIERKKISKRQKKILEFLEKQGKSQVYQVQQLFPELTKRTIRRDFKQLFNQGLVQRIGEKNETTYQVPER
jgi:replicative superfamily II helicase